MARWIAQEFGKDPSTKVGAVITRPDNSPVSFGVNGFPFSMDDSQEDWENREFKLKFVIHAEENAMAFARESLKGYTMYITHPPCTHCLSLISQKGISTVVYLEPNEEFKSRWDLDSTKVVASRLGLYLVEVKNEEI